MRQNLRNTIKVYYQLTKPGIIYGNLLTAVAGFFVGSGREFHLGLLLAMAVGTSLSIASACVLNNYIDRNIDKRMARTKDRALAAGTIPVRNAIIFAAVLGILGITILYFFTNLLTVIVGLVGVVDYLIFYGIFKRKSIHGTLIGAISGATPIVAGFTAAANTFDLGTLLLFCILIMWQMSHFYAIAIYRLKDYSKAGIPVLPVIKGIFITKIQILFYTILFLLSIILLTYFGYTGFIYIVAMGSISLWWLIVAIQGFRVTNTEKWARKMFFISLIVIMTFSLIIPIDSIIKHGILLLW